MQHYVTNEIVQTQRFLENCDILYLKIADGAGIYCFRIVDEKLFWIVSGKHFEFIGEMRLIVVTIINRNLRKRLAPFFGFLHYVLESDNLEKIFWAEPGMLFELSLKLPARQVALIGKRSYRVEAVAIHYRFDVSYESLIIIRDLLYSVK